MNLPAKYLFDTSLDAPSAPPPVDYNEVELLKARHRAELELARKEALEQGREEGREDARQSIEQDLTTQISSYIELTAKRQTELEERLQKLQSLSLQLATAVAEKLAGSLLARYPKEHIESFFNDSLSILPSTARIHLHLAPELVEVMQPRLEALMEQAGRQNILRLVGDETIEHADCRISWSSGGIERNTESLTEQIKKLVGTCAQTNDEASSSSHDKEGEQQPASATPRTSAPDGSSTS